MKRVNRIKLALHRGASRAFVLGPLVFLLVAGAGCPSLFESTTHRAVKIKQAQVGKDLAKTISAPDTVVNAYAALSANAAVGATTITVADITTLATNFATALSQGDLLLIIQIQGATIDTTDAAAYGTVTLGNAGHYEFVGVEGVAAGNQITLACALKNAYTVAGKTQVIRVPQYTTLVIATGASITARAWSGTATTGYPAYTGGIVAVHAQSTVTLTGTGKIDVSAKGFRGGAADDSSGPWNDPKVITYRSADPLEGAEKGESIAGYQGEYTNGRYGRGAPANGGGGGNTHNAGGGGGANAASGATWTGEGVMTTCSNTNPPTSAGPWRFDDAYAGNTCSNSEGGGRGGYTFSNAAQDPTAVAPGNTSWNGDNRQQVGGLGGRPVPNNPSGAQARLFMGGGGGAGDGDNGKAGRGGNGGGLVFLIAGQVTGAGSILANGEAGANATSTTGNWNDAPGGGGGGGTIVVSATSISAISITANGGPGGDHSGGYSANEVEGPGGGGGGGYVAVTSGSAAVISAAGGLAGTTDQAIMASFPENGATAGNAGVTNGSAATFLYCGGVLTTITGPAAHSNSPNASFTFTNTSSPVTYECRLDSTDAADWAPCNPGEAGAESHMVAGLLDGHHKLEVQATDAYGNVETPPAVYEWDIDTVAPVTTFATKPTNPSSSAIGVFVFTPSETAVTYECRLDGTSWSPCNAGTYSNPNNNYSTPALPNGSHTLEVRATDAAGNREAGPPFPTWAWDIEAGGLDGGAIDAESIDAELIDVGSVDAAESRDVLAILDAEQVEDVRIPLPDVKPDLGVVTTLDGGIVDAEIDAQGRDVLAILDVDQVVDVRVEMADTAPRDVLPDGQATGAELNPDTAQVVPVEPNRDTAPPANEDAAGVELTKLRGGGFCAIGQTRPGLPAGYLVLALAGLALLRRRRR